MLSLRIYNWNRSALLYEHHKTSTLLQNSIFSYSSAGNIRFKQPHTGTNATAYFTHTVILCSFLSVLLLGNNPLYNPKLTHITIILCVRNITQKGNTCATINCRWNIILYINFRDIKIACKVKLIDKSIDICSFVTRTIMKYSFIQRSSK